MEHAKINYVIDLAMGVSFLLVFVTGLIKWQGVGMWLRANGIDLPPFLTITLHDWSGIIMGILVFVHLVLHWKWIKAMTKNIFGRKRK